MKSKLLLIASVFGATLSSYGQENELPDAGNVGIGTTEPTEKLDVRGGARIDSTLVVGDSLNVTNSARMGQDLTVEGNAYLKNNAYVTLDFDVQGRTSLGKTTINDVFYLPSLSNTTNIGSYELMLREPESGEVVKSSIETLQGHMYSKVCSTVNGVVTSPAWANGPNKLYVECPEVFVGIGTSVPAYNLDVRGKGYFATNIQVGNISANNFTNTALFEGMRQENISGPLMRLAIRKMNGTNEIRFKVEADGTVYCTEVRVRPTTAIPDYVFKPTYELMPLKELRTFVTTNSHLPNIPSEAQILEQGGTNVNEMQMKLLEKIEELTLYILELDQRNEELEKEVEDLQLQIKNK